MNNPNLVMTKLLHILLQKNIHYLHTNRLDSLTTTTFSQWTIMPQPRTMVLKKKNKKKKKQKKTKNKKQKTNKQTKKQSKESYDKINYQQK